MPDVDGICIHIYESSKLEGSCVGDSLCRAEDQHGTYGGTEGLASCMNFKSAGQGKRRRLVLVSQAEELGFHTPGKLSLVIQDYTQCQGKLSLDHRGFYRILSLNAFRQ